MTTLGPKSILYNIAISTIYMGSLGTGLGWDGFRV